MITAQQAADISAKYSPELTSVWIKIKHAATHGYDCITLNHLAEQAQQALKDAGYTLYFSDCERGMSFWVVSWKDAAAKTK